MYFIKGMYVIWPDGNYLNLAIKAGIDTFFVNLIHSKRKKIKALFNKYTDKVTLIPTVSYTQPGRNLPSDQQFFDGTVHYSATACPTDVNAIDSLLEFPMNLYLDGLCDNIAIDFEDYGWHLYPNKVLRYHEEWDQDKYQCKCNKCKNLSESQQRIRNIEIIRDKLKGVPLYILPHVNPYIWSISDHWLNEGTYKEWGVCTRILKNTFRMKMKDITVNNYSGLWLEQFTAKDYLKMVKKAIKSSATDGYWIYPQMRMSKNCAWRLNPDTEYSKRSLADVPYHSFIDDPDNPSSDPYFFIKLKNLNESIDKYRSGIWFSIRNWITGFFR